MSIPLLGMTFCAKLYLLFFSPICLALFQLKCHFFSFPQVSLPLASTFPPLLPPFLLPEGNSQCPVISLSCNSFFQRTLLCLELPIQCKINYLICVVPTLEYMLSEGKGQCLGFAAPLSTDCRTVTGMQFKC